MAENLNPIAYFLVGPPGSGKSTWANKWLDKGFALVSTDNYIEQHAASLGKTYGEVFHDVIDNATKKMNEDIELLTSLKKNILWDQTNLSIKSRKNKLEKLLKAEYSVTAVAFECPAEELERRCKVRANQTGKVISRRILETMQASYVRPSLIEGFDRVLVVTPEINIEV